MRRFGGNMGSRATALISVASAALMGVVAPAAHAAGTPAGTSVTNVAATTFAIDGEPGRVPSNSVTTRIDEVLDVRLTPKSGSMVSVPFPMPSGFGVAFALTNGGNGSEAFLVKAEVSGQPPQGLRVAIDVDGNGAYDPAVDTLLPADGRTPTLPSGASVNLLALFDGAPTQAGVLTMHAQAATGSGTPATRFPGAGDGGSDAIVGATTAAADVSVNFAPGNAPATLRKSQKVLALDGTDIPSAFATITYTLELSTGSEALSDAELVDAIPAGSRFVPGSITLDGATVSDALFDGAAVRVAFGTINQPTTHVVTFEVTIL